MDTQVYRLLSDLHARWRPREFGKIVQKLLALGFHYAGFAHIVERGVQGVDVDAAAQAERYTTEVKTTTSPSIVFGTKDLLGLRSRQCDGYTPLLAVLRLTPLSDLILAQPLQLKCGRVQIENLRPFRCDSLETRIQPCFAKAVSDHFDGTYKGSQFYLDRVLRGCNIQVIDPVVNEAPTNWRRELPS